MLDCVLKLCMAISALRRAVGTILWIGFCHTGPISLRVYLFVLICVYFVCFCFVLHSCCIIVSAVGWTWWDWSLTLSTYLPSVTWHCWLGPLTCREPVPDMTCNVFSGTLLNQPTCLSVKVAVYRFSAQSNDCEQNDIKERRTDVCCDESCTPDELQNGRRALGRENSGSIFLWFCIGCVCSFIIVTITVRDWSLILRTYLSFSALTLLVGSFDP